MWLLVAAETPAPTGVSDQLIIVVGTVIVAAITTLGGVVIAIYNSKNKTTPSPPSPSPTASDHVLWERTAVLTRRADDGDERDELQDRRLDQIERRLDLDNPNWRIGDR